MNFPFSRILEVFCLSVRLEGTLFHRVTKIEFKQKKMLFLKNYNRIEMKLLRKILNLIFITGSYVRYNKDEVNNLSTGIYWC
jgi:hypothetical protein